MFTIMVQNLTKATGNLRKNLKINLKRYDKGSHQKKKLESGQENVKFFRQVVIFGVILPFYKGKMGQNFHKIEAVSLEGGDPPLA